MYKIYIKNLTDASDTLIYQSDNKSTNLIKEPKLSFEWQQPGSLEFSMLPGHPSYNDIHSMITFVTAYWDDEELFYGRVLTADKSLDGQKDVYCEGALSFLADGEVHSYDGTTTAQAFFSKCVTDYNATVEARKQFTVGTCEFTDSGIYFKMEDNSEAKSTIDDQLVKRLGGCLVVRKTTNGHAIDYLKQVGSTSAQKIRICENVQDRTEHDSGESVFTVLRPIGANDPDAKEPVKLSGSGVIEIPEMIAKYGRIIKTENFSDQTTEAGLRAEAEKFIARLGMSTDKLPATVDFSFVDFHYLNPSIGRIHFGDVFTDIEGYEGEAMTVGALELDLENPANDRLSLYNKTYLDAREYSALLNTATGNKSKGGGGGSSLAKTLSSLEETMQDRFWKHVNATDDTLMLFGDRIQLAADLLIGSTREYDVLASDVEELYGTHLHGNGNGFWEMYGKIARDDDGNIVIKDGVGLRVERTEDGVTASYGVYDEQTLTAGVMVDRINSDNTTYILGDRVVIGSVSITYANAPYVPGGSPKQLGYYENVNGTYARTSDTQFLAGKTYYTKRESIGPNSDSVSSRIVKESNRIELVVEGYGADATIRSAEIVAAINDEGSSVKIDADHIAIQATSGSGIVLDNNGNISINAAETVTRINGQTGSGTVYLNADKIKLNGEVIVGAVSSWGDGLTAARAGIGRLAILGESGASSSLDITGDVILRDGLKGQSDSYIYTPSISVDELYIGGGTGFRDGTDITTCVVASIGPATASGGQITIPWTRLDGTAGTPINFNIAATQFYLDHVAAAYANAVNRVSWPTPPRALSSFIVHAPTSPWNASTETGTTENRIFDLGVGAFDSNYIGVVDVTMKHNENGQAVTDGVVAEINVDASGVYSAGDTAGYNRAANQRTTLTATSNGTYTPSFGYSSVTVNVPSSSIAVNDIQLYASGYQQGTQSKTGVTTSLGSNSDGSDPVQIFSNTVFQLDHWYCFKINVNGVSKGYYFKASS